MSLKYAINWLFVVIVSSFLCATASAELVYEDTFDGDVEAVTYWPNFRAPDPEEEWLTIYQNFVRLPTEAEAGGGKLTIHTADKNGGVITHADDKYNFFDRELTFTFEGVEVAGVGKSQTIWQWANFGIVAHSDKLFWQLHSSVIIMYSGAGRFQLQVKQPLTNGSFDTEPRKEFLSRTFNFDVTYLQKIELTLDSVNYKVAFTFENELDQLTFGGKHFLDRDAWFYDSIGIGADETLMERSANRIAFYENEILEAAGDQVRIDNLQGTLDVWLGRYDRSSESYNEKLPEFETLKGRSAILMTASSDARTVMVTRAPGEVVVDENGRIGAKLTIDAVRVEATSKFIGL